MANGVLSKPVWHDYVTMFCTTSYEALFGVFRTPASGPSATRATVALQWSSLGVIMDAASFSVDLLDRWGCIDAILPRASIVERQRLLQDVMFH